jgi:hypothetical protein
MGLASTALFPTSTIGRWMRFGSATIAAITSASGVSSVRPAAAAPRVSFIGRTPVFLTSFVRPSTVNAWLK